MSARFEWVHASEMPVLLDPNGVEDAAPDGNRDQEWALCAGEVMIYGSLDALQDWLTKAQHLVLGELLDSR